MAFNTTACCPCKSADVAGAAEIPKLMRFLKCRRMATLSRMIVGCVSEFLLWLLAPERARSSSPGSAVPPHHITDPGASDAIAEGAREGLTLCCTFRGERKGWIRTLCIMHTYISHTHTHTHLIGHFQLLFLRATSN